METKKFANEKLKKKIFLSYIYIYTVYILVNLEPPIGIILVGITNSAISHVIIIL